MASMKFIEIWFRKGVDGRSIFYPYGILGKGYILSNQDEIKIKQFLGYYHIMSFLLALISAVFFSYFALCLLLIFVPFYFVRINFLLHNAQKAVERMSFEEIHRNMASSLGFGGVLFLLLAALVMMGASLFYLYLGKSVFLGIAGLLMTSLSILQSIYLFKLLISKKKTHSHKGVKS